MYCAGDGNFWRVNVDVTDVFCAFHVVIFAISARLGIAKPKVREIVAVGVVLNVGEHNKSVFFNAFLRRQ